MRTKVTILIVDREKILVDLLTRALSSGEVSVKGATSADEAVHQIDLHGADLVVIDPAIPNGIPLIASLRSAPLKAKVVALVSSEEMRNRMLQAGVEKTVNREAGLDALVGAIRGSLPQNLDILKTEGRISLLIADDEDEIRVVLAEFLTGKGYAVSTAKNGLEAIAAVQSDPALQIVLLDVSMPLMGGIEALGGIMSLDPHPNVIMMTAVADREIARQAMKHGAFDYILKPVNCASIESSIAACLSYSEYQKQPWWKRLTRR